MRLFLRLILGVPLLLLFSCKKYKPADAAFFIRSGKAYVATNPATQGSGSNNITDLWLYVNGQFQGVYPVGNLMPVVIKNNPSHISVLAGIKNNGISKTRLSWVFYDRIDLDTTVEAGKIIDRNFTFNYNNATTFAMDETFDNNGFKLINSPLSETTFSVVNSSEGSYEGKSMVMTLPTVHDSVGQVETAFSYTLPLATPNLYVEFDYKCDIQFEVGLICSDGTYRSILYINEQESWNKVYVSLATAANSSPTYSNYKLYFRMLRISNRTDALHMYLDNIKLVYI